MKHCRECKYWGYNGLCQNPLLRVDSPIYWENLKCEDLRSEGGKCGEDALYFKAPLTFWQWVSGLWRVKP